MNINAIPNNMEKYMAFMLGNHVNFIDSFQCMSSPLDKLVSNLPDEAFKYTSEVFNNEKFSLMKKQEAEQLITGWLNMNSFLLPNH